MRISKLVPADARLAEQRHPLNQWDRTRHRLVLMLHEQLESSLPWHLVWLREGLYFGPTPQKNEIETENSDRYG